MAGVIMSNDPRAAEFNPPEPVPCEFCGAPRYTKGIVIGGKKGKRIMWIPTGPNRCNCEQALAAAAVEEKEKEAARLAEEKAAAAEKDRERIARIMGDSGMGARFKHRTFDTFQQQEGNAQAYRTAKSYADNFKTLLDNPEEYEKNGLFITGSKGTGKTHLAAAVANELMSGGVPVLFITLIDLLGKIKATFHADHTTESEEKLLRLYKRVDLLIIDDMGKELPTPWALSKIYEVINARYEDYKPVIVTSNYTAEELVKRLTPKDGDKMTADATVDRILEMTYTVPLAGESWRTK
jgi:DNA replication protein DnaC